MTPKPISLSKYHLALFKATKGESLPPDERLRRVREITADNFALDVDGTPDALVIRHLHEIQAQVTPYWLNDLASILERSQDNPERFGGSADYTMMENVILLLFSDLRLTEVKLIANFNS